MNVFLPPTRRAKFAVVCLAFLLAIQVATIAAGFMQLDLLDRLDLQLAVSDEELAAHDSNQMSLNGLYLAVYLLCAVAFISWFYRVYTNIGALGYGTTRHSPGWAIGGWMVPFINLVRPYDIATEIWQASAPEPTQPGSHRFIKIWWALWIVGNIGGWLVFRSVDSAQTLAAIRAATYLDIGVSFIDIAGAVAAIVVIKRITARQEARIPVQMQAV